MRKTEEEKNEKEEEEESSKNDELLKLRQCFTLDVTIRSFCFCYYQVNTVFEVSSDLDHPQAYSKNRWSHDLS